MSVIKFKNIDEVMDIVENSFCIYVNAKREANFKDSRDATLWSTKLKLLMKTEHKKKLWKRLNLKIKGNQNDN